MARVYQSWTEQEDAILREHFGKKTLREISTMLTFKRFPSGVRIRAIKLGLLQKKEV